MDISLHSFILLIGLVVIGFIVWDGIKKARQSRNDKLILKLEEDFNDPDTEHQATLNNAKPAWDDTSGLEELEFNDELVDATLEHFSSQGDIGNKAENDKATLDHSVQFMSPKPENHFKVNAKEDSVSYQTEVSQAIEDSSKINTEEITTLEPNGALPVVESTEPNIQDRISVDKVGEEKREDKEFASSNRMMNTMDEQTQSNISADFSEKVSEKDRKINENQQSELARSIAAQQILPIEENHVAINSLTTRVKEQLLDSQNHGNLDQSNENQKNKVRPNEEVSELSSSENIQLKPIKSKKHSIKSEVIAQAMKKIDIPAKDMELKFKDRSSFLSNLEKAITHARKKPSSGAEVPNNTTSNLSPEENIEGTVPVLMESVELGNKIDPNVRNQVNEHRPERTPPRNDLSISTTSDMSSIEAFSALDNVDPLLDEVDKNVDAAVGECLANRSQAQEIIIINILKEQGGGLLGKDLNQVFKMCDLRHGELGIFHRFEQANAQGKIQFSIANAMKPGSFDLLDMDDMLTPGITLFMSLPGPENPLEAFDAMSEVAQVFARNFSAQLHDDSYSDLTPQTIEHYRQRIRDFTRKHLSGSS